MTPVTPEQAAAAAAPPVRHNMNLWRLFVLVLCVCGIALAILAAASVDNYYRTQDALDQLHAEQQVRCEKINDTNAAIQNIVKFLAERRQDASTPPLTPAQAITEQKILDLIPPPIHCTNE